MVFLKNGGKVLLFAISAFAFSILTSIMLSTMSMTLLKEQGQFFILLQRMGQLLGLLGFFIICFKSVGIFSSLGIQFQLRAIFNKRMLQAIILAFIIQLLVFFLYQLFGYSYEMVVTSIFEWLFLGMLYSLIIHFSISIVEELLFRGYLLQRLTLICGIKGAIIIQAFAFSLLHYFNTGFNGMAFIGLFLFGVLTAQLKILTNTLWFPIWFHVVWNVSQGTFFGYSVSGFTEKYSIFHMTLEKEEWLTGGIFGPEAGILTIGLLFTSCIILSIIIRLRHVKNH